jgi:hypothetical protein
MNKKVLACFLLFFLMTACTGIGYAVGDGMAVAHVFTWEDVNSNGMPDKDEPPIPFVTTSIGYPDALTSSDGWGNPTEFRAGCTGNCSEGETVMVKVPPGYKPTTPTSYVIKNGKSDYYFGFHSNGNSEKVSFLNEPDWQRAFINRGTKVLAFHYSANGQLDITLDRTGTVIDDYYLDSFTDQSFFDIYLFDIVLSLKGQDIVNISELQITLMPNNSVFLCHTSDIEEWTGQISGYEILNKHCQQEQ